MGVPQVRQGRGSALARGVRRLALASAMMGVSAGAFAAEMDLVINHQVAPADTGYAGGEFTYRPLVSINTDGVTATGVTLSQRLPVGVVLNSITSAKATCNVPVDSLPLTITAGNQTVSCELEPITAAGTANGIAVDFNVTIPTVNTNWKAFASATLASGDTDQDGNINNTNIEGNITTYDAADLGLVLTGPAGGTATQYQPFNYIAKVTNHGPTPIPADGKVLVKFTVPANTSVSGAGGSGGWTCAPAGGSAGVELTCSQAGPVANGAELADLVIPVTSTAAGEVELAATVSGEAADGSAFPDAVLGNNTKDAKVNIAAATNVNVTLAKAASPTTVDQQKTNNTVRFTLTPTRASGTAAADTVIITDDLPTGITITPGTAFTENTLDRWDCSASTTTKVSCTYKSTASTPNAGAAYRAVTFDATVDGTAISGASIDNVGVVNFGAGTNSATRTIFKSNKVKLTLDKTASKTPIKTGENFTYSLVIKNTGSLDVFDGKTITIKDSVPAGLAHLHVITINKTSFNINALQRAVHNVINCVFSCLFGCSHEGRKRHALDPGFCLDHRSTQQAADSSRSV